ncbi:trypsin-like serine protease [Georgenia sp. AZ-5]|uniref:trypsin-like serine protease n=1 Tax=Georgenia sp. AZ-5 TaxID=3367526 RepID=UPI003754E8E6
MRKTLLAALVTAGAAVLAPVASAITNGEPDGGRHPYVGLAVFEDDGVATRRCSAALLSATLVLTAGHCTSGADTARIWVDESVQDNPEYPGRGATSYDGVPYTAPGFCVECGDGATAVVVRDVGVVVLSEPVPTEVVSRYAELPDAWLVDTLPGETPVDIVGYGVQANVGGPNEPRWTGLRARYYAPSEIDAPGTYPNAEEFVRLSPDRSERHGGTCFGDSGAPDLARGTDTVLAVNSYVLNSTCAGDAYSQRVDIPEVLDWIGSFAEEAVPVAAAR